MLSKLSTAGEAARRRWHHNAGDNTNIKWLLPSWAGCLYNEDGTNRRCSIPQWQGPALGFLQFPVSFLQQKGALGLLHWGFAWSVGTWSKPEGFGHSQAERCLPLGWLWALPGAFMDLMELHLSCGWSHTQLTALTSILLHRWAADTPPDQSQQLTQVTPVSGHRGCTTTHVCAREGICAHYRVTCKQAAGQGLTASLPLHTASSFSGSRRGLCI